MSDTLNEKLPALKLALETLREGLNDLTTTVTLQWSKRAGRQDDCTYTLSTSSGVYQITGTIQIVEDLGQYTERSATSNASGNTDTAALSQLDSRRVMHGDY